MKCIYTLFVVAMVVRAGCHEDVDIDAVLSDDNEFQGFVTCFLETAPCSDVGAALKKDVPAVVLHGCEKCTPEQKHIVNGFIVGFKKMPKHFEAIKDKYDPERKYLGKLEANVAGF